MDNTTLRNIIREEIKNVMETLIIKYKVPKEYAKDINSLVRMRLKNILSYLGKNKSGDIVLGVNYKDRPELEKLLKHYTPGYAEII